MSRSFRKILLITWVLFAFSCKTSWVQKSYSTQKIEIDSTVNEVDSQVVKLYAPYKKILEKDMNRVISVSAYNMEKSKPESRLTNFLADLFLDAGIKQARQKNLGFTPDLSYTNYGGIRAPLPKGEITVRNVFELMPFENELVFLKLNGKQIQRFLNQIAANGGGSVAGVRFVIANGEAKNIRINGHSPEPNKSYWLVTNDYVAQGGDDFEILTENEKSIFSGLKIRDMIISELKQKQGKVIKVELDGRITNE